MLLLIVKRNHLPPAVERTLVLRSQEGCFRLEEDSPRGLKRLWKNPE